MCWDSLLSCLHTSQGCQMVHFLTKNPILGKIFRALDWTMLIYFMSVWNVLRIYEIFYDHLAHFVFIWCIFSGFGNMHKEKSGIPDTLPLTQTERLATISPVFKTWRFGATLFCRHPKLQPSKCRHQKCRWTKYVDNNYLPTITLPFRYVGYHLTPARGT
jgi:hypothetical protein